MAHSCVEKKGKKQNPAIPFGDSQFASADEATKICTGGPSWLHWSAGYLQRPSWGCDFSLGMTAEQKLKKLETSSLKGIRYNTVQFFVARYLHSDKGARCKQPLL